MNNQRSITFGQEIQLNDGAFIIAGFASGRLKLRSSLTGEYKIMHLNELPTELAEPPEPILADARNYEAASRVTRNQADILIEHLEELTARCLSPGAESALGPALEAKAAELTAIGVRISGRTLRRRLERYRESGPAGLVDRREIAQPTAVSRMDNRVVEALKSVIAGETNLSTGTINRLEFKLRKKLHELYPNEMIDVPPRSTLWRRVNDLTKGRYTLGNSKNRQTQDNSPKRVFESRPAIMPGHEVQIDSSPFDIMVMGAGNKPERVTLTIMIDKATRSIIANSVVPKAAKGVDHALLLARAVVPRQLRPSSQFFAHYELDAMPWLQVFDPEQVEKCEAIMPYIVPQRIITDNGRDFLSTTFRSACKLLEIDLTQASTRTPTDKAIVERTFGSISSMFAEHLPGYLGGSVDKRGKNPEKDAGLLDIHTLAELFDRWVAVVWQNRPHDGLIDPIDPTFVHTPNTMYMAMFDVTGAVRVPLSAEDYISFLPVVERTLVNIGFNIDYRRYDSPRLQPYRLQKSRDGTDGKWRVRYDPFNPNSVWVEDPDDNSWIECHWMNNDGFAKPFSRTIRAKARDINLALGNGIDQDQVELTMDLLADARTYAAEMRSVAERNDAARLRNETGGFGSPVLWEPDDHGAHESTSGNEADHAEPSDIQPFDPNESFL